ncbi:hypothetical protein HHL16_23935 [Pseudoflavitalea sp. G-6-1-2]|uniref:carboxypeptidase-like regulatory domain-containing protein n=1 Tax=Pseudoflavitalea sp. G-6-1-2 TaxID=2728841 RepID=UPI00146D0031|nr:carboxypeptidase-like regulatory domain-containing protein [Pseudoflavitalea sp. G-6-1-2]NML23953.1 hypothetical protein [Pseudoflavitalea sp. G-6-1-2]
MKVSRIRALLCILGLAFIYFSCQKDDYKEPPVPTLPVVEKVQSSVSGRVLDDKNLPVSGATVKAGNGSATTDLNGKFEIKNVTLNENAGFVSVEKSGFFNGSRTFKAIAGSKHYVAIQLIKKNDAGSFSSASGGDITVPNGGSIKIEAGAVMNPQTNTPYTGTVSVSAFLLDPTASNFLEIMPGELRGIDEQSKEVGLQSFGMMAVELTGAGGEHLQLAAGKPAVIKFPIAAAQQASAPATIAFWSFNDSTGLWKQEGVATRQGNEYIGKASHFSFWNCDAPFPVIDFKAKLKDQDSNPIKNTRVVMQVINEVYGPLSSGNSDTAGVIAGKIPSGKKLKFTVYSSCGEVIDTREIGPFSSTTDMGSIQITVPVNARVTFTATVVNCLGEPVQSGYADIGIQGVFERAVISNGVLNYSLVRCGSSATQAVVRATDVTGSAIGGLKEVAVTGTTVDLGQITVCGNDLTEYLIYKVDTMSRQFLPPADAVSLNGQGTRYSVGYYTADTSNSFNLGFSASAPGPVTEIYLGMDFKKERYEPVGAITMNVTEFGPIGGYIAATINGSVRNLDIPGSPAVNLTGRFRLKRNQ